MRLVKHTPVLRERDRVVALRLASLHRLRRGRVDDHLCSRAEHEDRCVVLAAILHEDAKAEQAVTVRPVFPHDRVAGVRGGPSHRVDVALPHDLWIEAVQQGLQAVQMRVALAGRKSHRESGDALAIDAALDSNPQAHVVFVRVGKDGVLREPLLCVGLGLECHRRGQTRERGAVVFVARLVVRALTRFIAVARRSAGGDDRRMFTKIPR